MIKGTIYEENITILSWSIPNKICEVKSDRTERTVIFTTIVRRFNDTFSKLT